MQMFKIWEDSTSSMNAAKSIEKQLFNRRASYENWLKWHGVKSSQSFLLLISLKKKKSKMDQVTKLYCVPTADKAFVHMLTHFSFPIH